MLKKFVLRNYKNFKDEISIDFRNVAGYQFGTDCISDGIISKMLIYGRNGTGKTNFGKALMNIHIILYERASFWKEGELLNVDSSEDTAFFSYTFQFGEQELLYRYALFSDMDLKEEELIIDKTLIYQCDFLNKEYHFENLKYIEAETANTERYLQFLDEKGEEAERQKIPFLRWLINNVVLRSSSLLIRLTDYVKKMVLKKTDMIAIMWAGQSYDHFFDFLEDSAKLNEFEEFLNAMGVKCKLDLKRLPDGQSELYFAHKKLIPFFENASSGTRTQTNLYRSVISNAKKASFLYLDEFDAFYHYEMAERVVKFLKRKYPHSQIVMSTHNTNLMSNRLMRPDCLFILSEEGKLTALCDATLRELREGHNLEKMYISGEFANYE